MAELTANGANARMIMKGYLLGYIPEGYDPRSATDRQELLGFMDTADFVSDAPNGVHVGQIVEVAVIIAHGLDESGPGLGTKLKCVGHEADGKIALFEPLLQN